LFGPNIVLFAALIVLFAGHCRPRLHDLVVGINRLAWVIVHTALLTGKYPPFDLDQGSSEPSRHFAESSTS
jgi:hypothetical protein